VSLSNLMFLGAGRDFVGPLLADYTDLQATKQALQQALQKLGGKVDLLVRGGPLVICLLKF
jgi:hypothetical protein